MFHLNVKANPYIDFIYAILTLKKAIPITEDSFITYHDAQNFVYSVLNDSEIEIIFLTLQKVKTAQLIEYLTEKLDAQSFIDNSPFKDQTLHLIELFKDENCLLAK